MPELKALTKPILFIHGENDYLPADPKNVKLVTDNLDNAEFYLIPGAGHMFFNKKLWDIIYDQILKNINNV